MKTISLETVDEIWDRLNNASEKEVLQIAKRMQEHQPALMVYLLATEDSMETEHEPGWLLFFGGVIFVVMSSQHPRLRMVQPDDVEAAEAANVAFLEQMEEGREMDWMEGTRKLFTTYNQTPLLQTILEALMEGNEETPEMAPDSVGVGLIALKTVIDCLDAPAAEIKT